MSKHWKGLNKVCFEMFKGAQVVTRSKIGYGACKKLVRDSEYSKSDNFKKFSVLAQILSFL